MSPLARLSRRLQLMVGRCVIRAVEASGGRILLTVDALDDEAADRVELAEPWGLTSAPLPGAEAVSLSIMGERGHRVALSMGDRRHRPRDLEPGETSLFDDVGNRIDILRDRIRITAPQRLEIVTPHATINGDAISTVGDRVQVGAGSSAGLWPLVEGVGDGP